MEIEHVHLLSSDWLPIAHEFLVMDQQELWEYITTTLLEAENSLYGEGNTAEHKLIFLTGPLNGIDIANARTSHGSAIYSKSPNHSKVGEIFEAIAAINFYVEGNGSIERVFSEVTDVCYNLVLLTELDKPYTQVYRDSLQLISQTIGISIKDFLLLSIAKYNYRLIGWGVKNGNAENDIISALITTQDDKPSIVSEPTFAQIDATLNVLNRIDEIYLKNRLQQIIFWETQYGFSQHDDGGNL